MAEVENGWRKVNTEFKQSEVRKKGSWVNVSRWGAVECLSEATALLVEIARERGLNKNEFMLDYWANTEKGQVGCIPVPIPVTSASTTALRWATQRGSVRCRFHIGAAFKENPNLAPATDVKCMTARETGPDGKPMLVIVVKASLPTYSSTAPGTRTAASEQ